MNATKMSLIALTAILTASVTATVHAVEWDQLSGEILFATLYTHSDSNLYTEGNPNLGKKSNRGDYGDKAIFTPLGNLNFDFGADRTHRLYVGTSRDDLSVGTLAFEFGYQKQLDSGTTVDVAYLPTVIPGEVWTNPYEIDESRTKTDVDGGAVRMKLSNLSQTNISLDMAYAYADVEEDNVPSQLLERDSQAYFIKAQYLSMLSRQSGINYGLSYTFHDADGKTNQHNRYGIEASYFFVSSSYAVAITGNYAHSDYRADNPIFDQSRTDNSYRLFIAYEYKDLGSWENWSIATFTGTRKNHSNIDFFTHREWLVSASLNYAF
ncbi:DUF2860 domain-containing protein [Vibrio cyclitrophicus]|uniref:DUF2860 family protein n=1 Tax=Vibrio cyclitrophicus TaxID=47951 RepID=UPI000C82D46E|nr:DUF2860 family protein [Vibrio cyclitrophicus]NOH44976.1 DUF2860 domain-containing protein [Vibrio cyclitrophicus]PMJ54437.1 hypothetical protein BCU19_17655 [Vibrio cyclitrophicus]